jgi:hypothetical protein
MSREERPRTSESAVWTIFGVSREVKRDYGWPWKSDVRFDGGEQLLRRKGTYECALPAKVMRGCLRQRFIRSPRQCS